MKTKIHRRIKMKRVLLLLPVVLLGVCLEFLLPNSRKVFNLPFSIDFRYVLLVALAISPYIVAFATIKNLKKQRDYQLIRHLDALIIVNSVPFGIVMGVIPFRYLPFLGNYEQWIWIIFSVTVLFGIGRLYNIFKKRNTDAVLLSLC
jgi:hypothetical protein